MNRRMFIKKIIAALGLLALPVMVLAGRKPESYPLRTSGSSKSTTPKRKMKIWTLQAEKIAARVVTSLSPTGFGIMAKIHFRRGVQPDSDMQIWDKIILKHRDKSIYIGYLAQWGFEDGRVVLYCDDAACLMSRGKMWTAPMRDEWKQVTINTVSKKGWTPGSVWNCMYEICKRTGNFTFKYKYPRR